mgnify:CR=1 FL=1
MKILLKIIWELIKDAVQAIGILIAFMYVSSGFGLLFAMCALEGLFSPLNSLVFIVSITFLILIIISWVIFIIRWFKARIKQQIQTL